MSTSFLISVEALASGMCLHRLTIPHDTPIEDLNDLTQCVIQAHKTQTPLYLLIDASRLDLAYTPRIRVCLDVLMTHIHQQHKTIRAAIILPDMTGSCTLFLNNLMRVRETSRNRHACFSTPPEALRWLDAIHHSESRPAVQGI